MSLVNRMSLVPDLRSNIRGKALFRPGLQLFNVGFDVDVTPQLRFIHNTNFLYFDSTESFGAIRISGQYFPHDRNGPQPGHGVSSFAQQQHRHCRGGRFAAALGFSGPLPQSGLTR